MPIVFNDQISDNSITYDDDTAPLLLNISANKYHGNIVFSLPNSTDNNYNNNSYDFNVINNYEIKGSNVTQFINDYKFNNKKSLSAQDVEIYKIKLEDQLKPLLEKQITSELKDQIEKKYINFYLQNLTTLLEKNNIAEEQIKKEEANLNTLKKYNDDQKIMLRDKEEKVNEMLKEITDVKSEFKNKKDENLKLLDFIKERKEMLKTKEKELLDKVAEMKSQLNILKDEQMRSNSKKMDDLGVNLKLLELKELTEKLEKEKIEINEEITKNNNLYEENQKYLDEKRNEIINRQSAIAKKDVELKLMEQEAKHEIIRRSLEYITPNSTYNKTDPLFDEIKRLDAKIMYDKLQIDLSINEITHLKEQLEKAKQKDEVEIVDKEKEIKDREKNIMAKAEEERAIREKEKALKEKLTKFEQELAQKEEYLNNLERRLLKISQNLKDKTMLVCPEKIAEWDAVDLDNINSVDTFSKLVIEKDDDGKIEYLNKLNANLIQEKLKIDSVNEILRNKDRELERKNDDLKKIEDHFMDLVTYEGDEPVIDQDQLKEVYKQFSKVGKIQERLRKIFEKLGKLKEMEEKLRQQKEILSQKEKNLQSELQKKDVYYQEEEDRINKEMEAVDKEIKKQSYLKKELEKKEFLLSEKDIDLNNKLLELKAQNDYYNKLGYVDLKTYQTEYERLIKEQKKLKDEKAKFEKEKADFLKYLENIMKDAEIDQEKRDNILNHKNILDKKSQELKDKQKKLSDLLKKLKELSEEDAALTKSTNSTLEYLNNLIKSNQNKTDQFNDYLTQQLAAINQEQLNQNKTATDLDAKEKYIKNILLSSNDTIIALQKQFQILKYKGFTDKDKLSKYNRDQVDEVNNELDALLAEEAKLKKLLAEKNIEHDNLSKKDIDLKKLKDNIDALIKKYNLDKYFKIHMNSSLEHLPCIDMFNNQNLVNYYLYSFKRCSQINELYQTINYEPTQRIKRQDQTVNIILI